jgi:hypothetical protein
MVPMPYLLRAFDGFGAIFNALATAKLLEKQFLALIMRFMGNEMAKAAFLVAGPTRTNQLYPSALNGMFVELA